MAASSVLAIGSLAGPVFGEDRESKYSGTVVAMDHAAGTIVVEGMGPWQVKDGVTQVQRRTIGIKPSTEFVRLTRATGTAPSGWVGDFVESALPGRQVKQGDWVTVTIKAEDKRPTAVRVDVWAPSEG
jgi:hypothetical protein